MGLILIVFCYSVIALINWEIAWIAEAWYATVPMALFFAAIVYRQGATHWLAAGATWFQDRRSWVDLYELSEVKIGASGVKQTLRLENPEGTKVEVSLAQLQRNQAMWDLVYNGIMHSVVSGQADPPTGTRTILRLPGGKAGRHRSF